jgi:F-type H+-transporting ATPase subunit b
MDKMLHQLGDLALGAVPTMVILVFLYVFLKAVFFNPLLKILKDRHAATEGSQKQAASSIAAAEAKAAEYAAKLEQARIEINRSREAARQQTLAARATLVEQTRAAARARIDAGKQTIQADVAAAREGLGASSRELADSITRMILR